MIIPISNKILDEFAVKNQEYLVIKKEYNFFNVKSGIQEYKLYSYLTTFFNNAIILDLGTINGNTAIALSHNETNQVISYDEVNSIDHNNHIIYSKPNVKFNIGNVLYDLNEELISKIKMVVIDMDYYRSFTNIKMIETVINKLNYYNYSGLIILDDITNYPISEIKHVINEFWNKIEYKKYDFTKYGHWTGTGIIMINTNIDFTFDDNTKL